MADDNTINEIEHLVLKIRQTTGHNNQHPTTLYRIVTKSVHWWATMSNRPWHMLFCIHNKALDYVGCKECKEDAPKILEQEKSR